jgi:hypothetical protein
MNNENNTSTITLTPKEMMLNAAKTWKIQNKAKGKVSKFVEHLDTIRYLRSSRHMSYQQITKFFNENGLNCTYGGLMNFVKKNRIGK